ncbi:hypothetical protein Pint_22000 [Pistacia integerrima]|uniref:Uncharacterized protein n=1 Tax=Pistacia integerrima TaxID=434235 RepID=A0ACC0YKU9_9ROSI|nr:hypothetical protein Pint_22000 [Pistacia integerrima]
MLRTRPFLIAILLVLPLQLFTYISYADADQTQFPSSNLFGVDNGASCGRQYSVSCISTTEPNTCLPGLTIQVKTLNMPFNLLLHLLVLAPPLFHRRQTAFAAITNSSSTATYMNIEFQQ